MSDWVREIYESNRSLLFRAAWLILHRTDLAEDAVHTAFTRIVSRPPSLNGNARAYVLKAVRNAAIDLRQQQNRLGSGTIDKWDLLPETITPPPDRSDRANAVYAELLRLKQTTQEIIQLHIHEQLSFREIGELLDLPLQTVASRYRRGLKQIEQNVRDHDRAD